MERVLTVILAGGEGQRLRPLTQERSKAAVPFGGKFRLIDFTLSNCINSGIRQIYLLTQYCSDSLQRHIQNGWGISNSGLGDFIYCIPAQQKAGQFWYRGTADAVRQNLDLVKRKNFEDVLILSGDHIYKMNYQQMVAYHRMKNAGLTIAAIRVRREQAAGRLGVLEVDRDHRLIGFEEKPAEPRTLPDAPDYALASMGIYVFQVSTLTEALQSQESDFGRHIIPGMLDRRHCIYIYDYEQENRIADFQVKTREEYRKKLLVDRIPDSTYWRDVGTLDSYYKASMDLLGTDPAFNLYGERWPFRTYQRLLPPSHCVGEGIMLDSIVCDDCLVNGATVSNSILSPGVVVEREALVEQSVIFDNVIIEPNARIKRTIVDKESRIRAGVSLGYDLNADKERGCTITESGLVVIPKGMEVKRSERSYRLVPPLLDRDRLLVSS